jgi:RimJ/RimL family protein N-acetyltransferase
MTNLDLPIDTGHLRLRSFELSDMDDLSCFYALPPAQRYLEWKYRDKSNLKEALEQMRHQTRLTRPGDVLSLVVERMSDSRVIGHMSLIWTDATASQAEIRFFFDPAVRTENFGAESVRKMLDIGFEQFGFHRIFARCDARSLGSAALLKELGMRLEAHFREHALFQGDWDEEMIFAILDREWVRSDTQGEQQAALVRAVKPAVSALRVI